MSIYNEYAKIKIEVKVAQKRLKELEPKILEEIRKLSEPMKSELGTFTKVISESWKYTDVVAEAEAKVKEKMEAINELIAPLVARVDALKEEEQKNGKAQRIESVGLRFIEGKQS